MFILNCDHIDSPYDLYCLQVAAGYVNHSFFWLVRMDSEDEHWANVNESATAAIARYHRISAFAGHMGQYEGQPTLYAMCTKCRSVNAVQGMTEILSRAKGLR